MKLAAMVALACLLPAAGLAAWTPPERPDLHQVLNSARDDRIAGRHEEALAKYVWFHEHALEHDPAFYGVRVSFAINDWRMLGEKYPPALAALRATRDRAEADVRTGRRVRMAFVEASSMNSALDEPARTVALFREVEAVDPATAKTLWRTAEDAFVEMKDIGTIVRHMDAEMMVNEAIGTRAHMERQKQPSAPGFDPQALTRRMYAERVARAVALLVLAGRPAEARAAAAKARQAYPDAAPALERALTGEMPEPTFNRADRAAWRRTQR